MFPSNAVLLLVRRGYGLLKPNISLTHSYSSSSTTQVVVADGGRTLVCWHPEPAFPYEHSLPLPKPIEEETSVIKSLNGISSRDVSHLESMKEELAREQLMNMTHTTKHRWFPRLQKRRAKKTRMERPYL